MLLRALLIPLPLGFLLLLWLLPLLILLPIGLRLRLSCGLGRLLPLFGRFVLLLLSFVVLRIILPLLA